MKDFARRAAELGRGDVALLYYSGHGLVNEENSTLYLIPTDVDELGTEATFLKSVSLQDEVLKPFNSIMGPAIVVAIDACRDEVHLPVKTRGGAAFKGFSPPPPAGGLLVSFAADAGKTASDGEGSNSPYSLALSQLLKQPGQRLSSVMIGLTARVSDLTDGKQRPVVGSISLYSDPVLVPVDGGGANGQSADLSSRPSAKVPEPAEPDTSEKTPASEVKVSAPAIDANTPAGTVFRDKGCPGGCPELVVVPAGSFMMGSPSSEEDRMGYEGPQHRVTIPASVAIGKFEVTRGEWQRFVEETGSGRGDGCDADDGTGNWRLSPQRNWQSPGFSQTDQHPVVCVSWEGAQAYVKWLSEKTGHTYRLLSEAEWEYAARAGTTSRFIWGNDANGGCDLANGADQSEKRMLKYNWIYSTCDDGVVHTAAAGRYAANGFGLHDMIGNVWEWTDDCFNETYAGAPDDGSPWLSGECKFRVHRGGSWGEFPQILRSAFRGLHTPTSRANSLGFRVARTL